MNYIKVTFPVQSQDACDVLTALLAEENYEGFEEAGDKLLAYIKEADFDEGALKRITDVSGVPWSCETIPSKNWNEEWEASFSPVIVDDFCTIRAHFHNIQVTTRHEIIITPKMSFGTGHHATTQLMIQLMKETDFLGKKVIDFGTGTGVLAILAAQLGAAAILAIDNDTWSIENARENIAANNCSTITIRPGSLEEAAGFHADIILANINKNILLRYMRPLYDQLNAGGIVLMSGLLVDDEDIIRQTATQAGFREAEVRKLGSWIIFRL